MEEKGAHDSPTFVEVLLEVDGCGERKSQLFGELWSLLHFPLLRGEPQNLAYTGSTNWS